MGYPPFTSKGLSSDRSSLNATLLLAMVLVLLGGSLRGRVSVLVTLIVPVLPPPDL